MATYQVEMTKGPAQGTVYNLSGANITIGRDINADIVIPIPEVSRKHAIFRLEGGVYYLEDDGSTNGTFVNGQRLNTPHRMRPGETIMLGEAVNLIFRASGAPDPNATIVASTSQASTMVAGDQEDFESFTPGNTYKVDDYEAPPPIAIPDPYPNQFPSGTADFGDDRPSRKSPNRTWLYASLGCIFILILGCIAIALLFDTMDMYCQPPFDSLFSFLYTCP